MNNLRDKARMAFYATKRNKKILHTNSDLAKILESVKEPIALHGCEVWGLLTKDFTKRDKHQFETLNAEYCINGFRVQPPNNACRVELGRYPLMIKI